jgi:glyoxylase-like metal-dependent hydrolase (beta-lactamase superfamily II)
MAKDRMKLTFLGTRGNIEARSRRHKRHSALLVIYHQRRVMIDCGVDWRDEIADVAPHAIFVTHAHPDHAWGLADGADCPVYATAVTWKAIARYPRDERVEIKPRTPVHLISPYLDLGLVWLSFVAAGSGAREVAPLSDKRSIMPSTPCHQRGGLPAQYDVNLQ